MKAKRILIAGLALAMVVGTNAMIYSPTFAGRGEVTVKVTPEARDAKIKYGEESDFAFTLSVKNETNQDIEVNACNSSNNIFKGTLNSENKNVAKGKEKADVCKFTFVEKEDGSHYDVKEEYKSDFSVSYGDDLKSVAKEGKVEIKKKAVTMPKAIDSPLTYNGEEQSILSSDDITSGVISVEGDISAVNVGNYEYSLSLTDNKNYEWDAKPAQKPKDGKIDGKWSIVRAGLDLNLSIDDWTYGDEASEPVLTGNEGEGEVTYSYYAGMIKLEGVPTEVGKYSVCAKVAETDNYEKGRDCTRFEITKREVTVSIFGNTATFVYDGLKKSVSGYTSEISDSLYSSDDFFASGIAFEPLTAVEVGTYVDELSEEHFFNINRNFDVEFVVTPHVLIIEEPAVVTPTKKVSTPVATPNTGTFTNVEETAGSNSASATIVMSVISVITACGIAVAYRARR